MDDHELKHHLDSAVEAAFGAGKILELGFHKRGEYRNKSILGDLVTETDLRSEEFIFSLLKGRYQSYGFIGEESSQEETLHEALARKLTWIVDPLDGTTNFAHTYPQISISIALVESMRPIVAVVYNPILKELFTARRGGGAFFNGLPIQVSNCSKLEESLLATGFAYDRKMRYDNNYPEFFHLTNLTHGIRRDGSAAIDLAYVACGRLEGYWEWGLKMWDLAAGTLLIEEAAGKISDLDRSPFDLMTGRILATNGKIHKELSLELEKAKSSQR